MRGFDKRHPALRVRFDDGNEVPDGYFAICLNTNPYTYLGNRPLDLSPAATLDRGLVLITFRTMKATAHPRRRSPWRCGAAGCPTGPTCTRPPTSTHVVIEGERGFPYQVDGDYLGETRRLEFRHVPDALTLALP